MIQVKNNVFYLSGKEYTYCFYEEGKKLYHGYFGRKLFGEFQPEANNGVDRAQYEYSEFGRGDFRIPAIAIHNERLASTDLRFERYEIVKNKPSFGLPSLYGATETLVVVLKDSLAKIEVKLFYTPYEEGLAKQVSIRNMSNEAIYVDKLMSSCLELSAADYEIIDLSGRPNLERQYNREKMTMGIRSFSSMRGITSHQHSSFVAIVTPETDEEFGETYGLNLIYSGNFAIEVEKDELLQLRANVGMQLLHGGIRLSENEELTSPEAILVYSDNGLGGMSRSFHKLYRKHLINPKFVDKIRPIVINSWESVVFDISEEKLLAFIRSAGGLGIDMIVLDDGWFGVRNNDDCSLGDWFVDRNKLPNGLKPIIDCAHENNMKFGLWFEPESISPNSDLCRAHPEWVLGTNGREGVQFRQQWCLDFSNTEVVAYIFESIKKILKEYEIDYIKWDMNRPLTDIENAKKYYDYEKGVYALYDMLSKEFPDVLIEGCASGGGRFDAGILQYSPMIWTSDNTDAWERAKIQYTTSFCFPLQTMSNHVSKCPNIQTGRVTPLSTRGAIASLGALGYELKTADLSIPEKEEIRRQIRTYKDDAELILTGDLYRLKNPFTDGCFCELIVDDKKTQAYFVYMRSLNEPHVFVQPYVKLKGLNSEKYYLLEERGEIRSGESLEKIGIRPILPVGDFASEVIHLRELEKIPKE